MCFWLMKISPLVSEMHSGQDLRPFEAPCVSPRLTDHASPHLWPSCGFESWQSAHWSWDIFQTRFGALCGPFWAPCGPRAKWPSPCKSMAIYGQTRFWAFSGPLWAPFYSEGKMTKPVHIYGHPWLWVQNLGPFQALYEPFILVWGMRSEGKMTKPVHIYGHVSKKDSGPFQALHEPLILVWGWSDETPLYELQRSAECWDIVWTKFGGQKERKEGTEEGRNEQMNEWRPLQLVNTEEEEDRGRAGGAGARLKAICGPPTMWVRPA